MIKNIVFFFLIPIMLFGQNFSSEKISAPLQNELNVSTQAQLVWITFADKGSSELHSAMKPLQILSAKSIERRKKVRDENAILDYSDYPIYEPYISAITDKGIAVKQRSRWFNSISAYATQEQIRNIAALPFVKKIELVKRYKRIETLQNTEIQKKQFAAKSDSLVYDYGNSIIQMEQINATLLHNFGYTGQGVTIAVMDAGFNNLEHECFENMNIIASYDFVNNDNNVDDEGDLGSGNHGTQTLSAIGGFKEGSLVSPAFEASFILAKTENTYTELPVEEDNWIAALEWADSIGVDITSTSLSYIDFDAPYDFYTWEDMDGNTTKITIAADLAVSKGILVVNSMGNNGYHDTHNTIGAPADGDSVFAIGSVNSTGTRSYFSGVGNTIDGRIKPDVMAMGQSVVTASTSNITSYSYSNGTSFSCPLVTGVCAQLLSYNPNLTPMEIMDALRSTASQHDNPNREYGYGIVDALAAYESLRIPVSLVSFSASITENGIQLNWETATETNNSGFEVQRSANNSVWQSIGFVEGNGSSTEINTYSFTDTEPMNGKNFYRLKQIDLSGTFNYSSVLEINTDTPQEYKLQQNYPNPFNPGTTISFIIPEESDVTVKIYDATGELVRLLVSAHLSQGQHQYYFASDNLASGTYFATIVAGDFTKTIKMTLVK